MIKTEHYNYTVKNVVRDEIEYILASSVVIKTTFDGRTFYFRECEMHLPIKEFVVVFINYYWDIILRGEYQQEKEIIINNLREKNNFIKFINMGSKYPITTPFHKVFVDNEDPSIVGLKVDSYMKNARLKGFLRFSSNKLRTYSMNHIILFSNKMHFFHSNRNYAYMEICSFFKCGGFSPKVEYGFLSIDGGAKTFGLFMDEALGVSLTDFSIEERKARTSPIMQKNLTNLCLIDYICGIRDHTPRNYNVISRSEDEKFYSVQCYDNDDCGSFGVETTAFSGYSGVTLISEDGFVLRPFLDQEFINTLGSVKKNELFDKLNTCLTKKQIELIWTKLCYLLKCIKKTETIRHNILINEDKWSNETIEEELSGKYGKTYLHDYFYMDSGPKIDYL